MAILEVRSLTKRFGGLTANSDVSFEVPERGVVGLIGPNGAGKTTLFNCITGYYAPSGGEVVFNGRVINGWSPDRVCKAGMVRTWQKVRPLAGLSVLDNVMVGALLRTSSMRSARDAAMDHLHVVRLDTKAGALASSLSIGERKKLEVARALATEPKLVLLDEVMGGLNPAERDEIIEIIQRLREHSIAVVIIEHDVKAIVRVSDRVVVLNSGEKLAEGTPEQIVKDPRVIEAYLGTSGAPC